MAIEVHEVRVDRNSPYASPLDADAFVRMFPDPFDTRPMLDRWEVLYCDIWRDVGRVPLSANVDCIGFSVGTFAIGRRAKDLCGEILEQDCELLPIDVEGQAFWLVNVTSVRNALDELGTEFRINAGGVRTVPSRWSFHRPDVGDPGLFKVPGMNYALLSACRTSEVGRENDFYHCYKANGLTGLKFVKVWDEAH